MTPQQSICLDVIRAFIAEHDFSPSFEEIRKMMGLATKSQVHDLIRGLEARGKITVVRYRARSIEIVDDGPNLSRMSLAGLRKLVAEAQAEIAVRLQGRPHFE